MDTINDVTKLTEYTRSISADIDTLTRDIGEMEDGEVKDYLKELQLDQLEWLQKATILLTQTLLLNNMPEDNMPEQDEENHEDDAFMQGELNDHPEDDIEAADTYPFVTTEEKAQETSATEEEKEK